MANVPIVTDVTKVELDTLVAANGLEEGLQYKVTDKGWLLVAISVNTLVPAAKLIVMYNDTFPNYIISDKLLIDTGNLIDVPDATDTTINVPAGFVLSKVFVKNNNIADIITGLSISTSLDMAVSFSGWELSPNQLLQGSPAVDGILYEDNFNLKLYMTGNTDSDGDGVRTVFEVLKLEF